MNGNFSQFPRDGCGRKVRYYSIVSPVSLPRTPLYLEGGCPRVCKQLTVEHDEVSSEAMFLESELV